MLLKFIKLQGWNRNVVQQVATPPPAVAQAISSNETRSKDPDYYDYENDNALEESISRLVLDDMEDTEDEEEARKIKLSRLGATSNFNTYFMPPQVSFACYLVCCFYYTYIIVLFYYIIIY